MAATAATASAVSSEMPPIFQRSVPLPPSTFENDQWFCQFTPRVHREAHLADEGSWNCQVDFLEASEQAKADAQRNNAHTGYAVGCINPVGGNFTAVCFCEARPERLALASYVMECAFIHDDVIEYAENKSQTQLAQTNQDFTEGLLADHDQSKGTKEHVRRRQLQAKMTEELLQVDKELGHECLRLWEEMSKVLVPIRDLKFQTLNDYISSRIVDAGCPWTMSVNCFSMGFTLDADEKMRTSAITVEAYAAIVLVNDYFSWDKELKNFEANGSQGEIVNAVFLFAKWHAIDWDDAKRLLKAEIMSRETAYRKAKEDFLATEETTKNIADWFELLDLAAAGNFVWSMTSARYIAGAADAYPDLRAAHHREDSADSKFIDSSGSTDDFSQAHPALSKSAAD